MSAEYKSLRTHYFQVSSVKPQSSEPRNTNNNAALVEYKCMLDLIDMTATPDGSYNYIMLYRDNRTKFVSMKPLTSDDPKVLFTESLKR